MLLKKRKNGWKIPNLCRISTIEGKFGVEHLFAAIFQESGAFLVAKEVVGEGQRGGGGTGRMWSRIALRAGWVTERARSRAYRVSSPRWRERCSRAEYSCRSSVACWPASRSFLYTTSIPLIPTLRHRVSCCASRLFYTFSQIHHRNLS